MEVASNPSNTNVSGVASPAPRDSSPRIFRFGAFELRTETGELWKHGTRLRLQIKPLRVLEALLEQAGELVTREELRKRLWTAGTFVDFESGLNTATNRLRAALGDSAESPRYIETVPRLGYRFICPVTEVEEDGPVPRITAAISQPRVMAAVSAKASQINWGHARRFTQVAAIAFILFGFLFAVEYFVRS